MLARQLRLLLILGAALAALLLFLKFGPEPTPEELTPDEFAEWTIPNDTGFPPAAEYRVVGDPTVDWYVIEVTEFVPLDTGDPCGPALEIVTQDVCWMSAEPQEPTYY